MRFEKRGRNKQPPSLSLSLSLRYLFLCFAIPIWFSLNVSPFGGFWFPVAIKAGAGVPVTFNNTLKAAARDGGNPAQLWQSLFFYILLFLYFLTPLAPSPQWTAM